ncbi:hypothetical protein [Brumimicrobium mesophilum]|uniref:hypothetical protein n=1 Tax=Brumimicrobium mesophilum TaxID=392717 RepID=UPI000D1428DF|nr:hypothetical protein [Brumimicrobium mesophilum]
MKKVTLFIMLISLFTFISSCNKDKTEIFYWDETSCSDPWQANAYDPEEEKKASIKLYLLNEDISVEAVNFEFDSSKAQFCEACSCTTGNIIAMKVSSKDTGKMEELNFYQ